MFECVLLLVVFVDFDVFLLMLFLCCGILVWWALYFIWFSLRCDVGLVGGLAVYGVLLAGLVLTSWWFVVGVWRRFNLCVLRVGCLVIAWVFTVDFWFGFGLVG